MKKKILPFALIMIINSCEPDKKNLQEVVNNNQQHISQKIVLNQKNNPADCSQQFGYNLTACMDAQSRENLKKNLLAFNDRMARNYLLGLSLDEYRELITNFTEQEWQLFYEKRSPVYQQLFPKTLEEQRRLLKQLYIKGYYFTTLSGFILYPFSGADPNNTSDLESFIKEYHLSLAAGGISAETHTKMLNNFKILKETLFAK